MRGLVLRERGLLGLAVPPRSRQDPLLLLEALELPFKLGANLGDLGLGAAELGLELPALGPLGF
jgi:hypothetical protein